MVEVEAKITDKANSIIVKVSSTSILNTIYVIPHDVWSGTTDYDDTAEVSRYVYDSNIKTYEVEIEKTEFQSGLDAKMYYVVATASNGEVGITATFYKHPMYLNFMRLIREITEGCCEPPKDFVDLLLRLKSLEYALKSKHYVEASKIYDQFFMVKQPTGEVKRGCKCHGR